MIKKWIVSSSKYLFDNKPWLTIREDNLIMPKGGIMNGYYVFEYPNWVSVIAIDKNGDFIMVEQYRHAIGEVNYELSAGVCDDTDEDMLESAKRELLEETGYGGGKWSEWIINSANPGTHTNLTYCFLAEGVERLKDQDLDDTEDMAVHVFSVQKIIRLLMNNEIRQSLHASALWKYIALKRKEDMAANTISS